MLPSDFDTTGDGANRRGDANGRSDSDASGALVGRDAGCGGGRGGALAGARPSGGRLHFALCRYWATVPDWLWPGLECSDWLWPGLECSTTSW